MPRIDYLQVNERIKSIDRPKQILLNPTNLTDVDIKKHPALNSKVDMI